MNKFLLISLFIFGACAHIKSGTYVYFPQGVSLADFAHDYGVTVSDLEQANEKERLKAGEWVFVPTNIGIIPKLYFQYDYQDFYGGEGQFLWPVPTYRKLSSLYGPRGGRRHEGIDIPAPRGTQIVASESGKVIFSGSGIKGYGNLTIIAHKNNYFTVYAHASKNLKRKGDIVKRGEIIALVGNTGRSSGPHLHFEIRKKSKALDPIAFLGSAGKRAIASSF